MSSAPAVASEPAVTTDPAARLAAPPTPFVGREREIAAVVALLSRPDVRLVTLTGPGGIGKTRLALRVVEEVAGNYPDGTVGVPLAPLRDVGLVLPTIAEAIGAREDPSRSLFDGLIEALVGRRLLLLLDNCEHVVAAARDLARLLVACPELTLLATSRESLRITGEREVAVPPLSLGRGDEETRRRGDEERPIVPSSHRPIVWPEAVRLFVERAQAVRPDFALTEENAGTVADICVRLDGLPLAIELAAARLKILSPAALANRLDRRLPLLTRGARDLPARLLTMRDAIAWSHDLLATDDQRFFRRLALFAGGFTIEAAAAVAAAGDEIAAVDGVTSLADKSLLRADPGTGGAPNDDGDRYVMLETIREFGLEQLTERGELEEVRRRHAAWCLDLARRAFAALNGPERGIWLLRLEAEHANLRAAFDSAVVLGDGELAFALIGQLWRYLEARGHLTEGSGWHQRAAPLADRATPFTRAFGLYGCSVFAYRRGDYDRAVALCEEALDLFRALDDRLHVAMALNGLANVAFERGEFGRAVAWHEEALAIRRRLGEVRAVSTSLVNLGIVLYQMGDFARSRDLYAEALASRRADGDVDGLAFALNGLGITNHRLGDLETARAALLEAIEIRRPTDSGSLAASLGNLAEVERDAGNLTLAIELYREGATLRWRRDERKGVAEAVAGLAVIAAWRGQHDLAVRLFAAAEAICERLGARISEPERPNRERAIAAARAALGRDAFAAAWEIGERLSLDEVLAQLDLVGVAALLEEAAPAPRELPGGLSARELDVLRLVVDGLTDAEIGARLYISPRTVARHLYTIYQKLGVNSRTAATAFAFKHGIV
jgi:non-specific serine/threonine protein kinase